MVINIHENLKKIKLPKQATGHHAKTVYIILIFLISMLVSFMIGRSTALEHIKSNSVNNTANSSNFNKNNSQNSNQIYKITGLPQEVSRNGNSPNQSNTNDPDNQIKLVGGQSGTGSLSDQSSSSSGSSTAGDVPSEDVTQVSGSVYASPRGSKYYLPWCSGGKTLKDKIYFNSEQEAIQKGYSKSSTCK